MIRKFFTLAALLLLIGALPFFARQTRDNPEMTLTIYEDLALVEEVRTLNISEGEGLYRLQGVPVGIIPTSVYLEVEAPASPLTILEQSYEYDPINTERLLKEHIGQEIEVFAQGGLGFYRGILLGTAGGIILQDGSGRVHVINDPARFIFHKLPPFTKEPTLVWLIASPTSGDFLTKLNYLTTGLSWNARYVGIISPDEKEMKLSSWISVTNNSGLTYKDAKLNLVAGKLHRVEEERAVPLLKAAGEVAAAAPFERREAFEYHLYALKRRTTLPDGKTKQLSFIAADKVLTEKIYIFEGQVRTGVQARIGFINSEESGLGEPLPAGLFRIYKRDEAGLQFIGEDLIAHTPKGEKVELTLGIAFDIVGERKQTLHRILGENQYRDAFEITLRNHKSEDVTIRVIEHLQGDWNILEAIPAYTKLDARTIEFLLPVAAGGEATVKYVVEYKFR